MTAITLTSLFGALSDAALYVAANLPEVIGAVTGICGALMLAMKSRLSAWAWPVWIASNFAWIYYAVSLHAYGMLTQQAVFLTINLFGTWQWLYRKAPVDQDNEVSRLLERHEQATSI